MFPSFSLDFLLRLEEDTFYYWYRRALEQKTGKEVAEMDDKNSVKVDDDTFKRQLEYMDKKLAEQKKAKEGIING